MVAGALEYRDERPGDPSRFIDLLDELARQCGIQRGSVA